MHSHNSASCWGAIFGSQDFLPADKRVSEVGCNAARQVIQLLCAVVNEADDWLLIYGRKLLQAGVDNRSGIEWDAKWPMTGS